MTQTSAQGLVPAWTVGDRLRKAREITGLDAGQFAEAIGVARNTIGNYEKERVEHRRVVLNAWAARTGVSYDWLVTGQHPADVEPVEVPQPRGEVADSRDERSGDTHRFAGSFAVSAA